MNNMISSQSNDTGVVPEPIAQPVDMLFRVVTAIILILSVNFSEQFPRYSELALFASIALAALYFMLAFLPGYSRPGEKPRKDAQILVSYLDVFLLGVAVLLIPFSLVVVSTIAILTAIRALSLGGLTRFFGHMTTLATGMTVAIALSQPVLTVRPTETINVFLVFCAPAFLGYLGWRFFHDRRALASALQAANVSNLELKLHNYKLAKYLSPSLRKAILSGKRVTLETQRKKLSVFFSDIKGFSELSEELETETLTSMLNLYLTEMSDIALKFGGTVDKFIGDGIMVFFGDPLSRGVKEDCIACVAMALAMQKRMKDLNQRWQAQGIKQPLLVRMGINTGFCTVGNFGTENRLDYTLLGTEVNKASRLESASHPGEIFVSRSTYDLIKDVIYCEPRGSIRLKGFKDMVEAYAAVDLRANLGKEDLCIDRVTDGFSMYMDVENIPHMQKQRVMASLEEAYEQLRKDIESNTLVDIKIVK